MGCFGGIADRKGVDEKKKTTLKKDWTVEKLLAVYNAQLEGKPVEGYENLVYANRLSLFIERNPVIGSCEVDTSYKQEVIR